MRLFGKKKIKSYLDKPIHNHMYWYKIPVNGWIIPPKKVQFIEVTINDCDKQRIAIGTDCRPDLQDVFPSIRDAAKGGFYGTIHLGDSEGIYEMEFRAKLEGGESHFLGKRKIINSKKVIVQPPTLFHLGLTTRCNISCTMCPVHNNEMIHANQFRDIEPPVLSQALKDLEENAKSIQRIILTDFGEPFLYKDIFEVIEQLHQICPTASIFVNTNGLMLTENIIQKIIDSHLNEISFSLDAVTNSTHEKIRKNSDFDTVITNLKRIVQMKREFGKNSLKILSNFVIMKSNICELSDYVRLTGELGVDLIVAVNPFGIFPSDSSELLFKGFPKEEIRDCSYRDILKETRKIAGKQKYPLVIIPDHSTAPRLDCRCYGASLPRIAPNGDVFPCSVFSVKGYEKDSNISPFGNLNTNSLQEIWRSEIYYQFRKSFYEGKLPHPLCQKCSKYYNL